MRSLRPACEEARRDDRAVLVSIDLLMHDRFRAQHVGSQPPDLVANYANAIVHYGVLDNPGGR